MIVRLLVAAFFLLPGVALAQEEFPLPTTPTTPRPFVREEPSGINVHYVAGGEKGVFWRGAAPRRDTLQALLKSAQARNVKVTLIDLRHPANSDDRSGKSGRLSPHSENQACQEMGLHYESVSAMDGNLIGVLKEALARGDVYIHCMYGVNRTGFAVGRFATAQRLKVERDGLGRRDWEQGVRWQQRVNR